MSDFFVVDSNTPDRRLIQSDLPWTVSAAAEILCRLRPESV